MVRIRKTGRRQNVTGRSVVPAFDHSVADTPTGPPDDPDRPDSGPPGQREVPAPDTSVRSDIEHASERKPGSIESVPHDPWTAGLPSFEEPSGGAPVIP